MTEDFRAAPPIKCPHCGIEKESFIVYSGIKKTTPYRCGNCMKTFEVTHQGDEDNLNIEISVTATNG